MPTDDLSRVCCRNPGCDTYGRCGGDNLLVIDRFGKAHHRLLLEPYTPWRPWKNKGLKGRGALIRGVFAPPFARNPLVFRLPNL
jgi:hypothetical protein